MLLLFFIVILLIPQLRFPIQVEAQKFLSVLYSPVDVLKEPSSKIGYNWSMKSSSENVVSLYHNGKPKIINLWATWCPPCVAEMPSFQKLHEDYSHKVDFVFLSQEPLGTIQAFIDKNNYTLPVFQQTEVLPETLESRELPTTFIINAEGEIIVKKIGAANWNSNQVRELLNSLTTE